MSLVLDDDGEALAAVQTFSLLGLGWHTGKSVGGSLRGRHGGGGEEGGTGRVQ